MRLGDDVIDEDIESAEFVILLQVLGVIIPPVPVSPRPRNPTRPTRWIDHVVRMPDSRLPKHIFYCQLKEGKRSRGAQKKRYKYLLKLIWRSATSKQARGRPKPGTDQPGGRPSPKELLPSKPTTVVTSREREGKGRRENYALEPNSQLELPALTAGGSPWPGLA